MAVSLNNSIVKNPYGDPFAYKSSPPLVRTKPLVSVAPPAAAASQRAYLPADQNSANQNSASKLNGGTNTLSAAQIAAARAAAQESAQYDQAIGNVQAGINRTDAEFNSGNSGIDASFMDAINSLLLGKNQANGVYTTNKKQTANDFVGAKNTIGSNAGQTLAGLWRLLGSRGAGGGSAYRLAAPGAVARDATIQRSDAGNTFGSNNQSLDLNWGNYMTGYDNEVSSANRQRENQKSELNNSVQTRKATLLQQLASLQAKKAEAAGGNGVGASQASLDAANSILDNLSSYTVKPIEYKTQAYQAPELSTYVTNNNARPTFEGQAPENDYTSPYLAALLGKKRQAATA